MNKNELSKKAIYKKAKERVASVFNVSAESLHLEDRFDFELKASFVSDFKQNEFDLIDFDIRDVADKVVLKRLRKGSIVIHSVEDYCRHMCECYKTKPDEVCEVLGF